MSANTLDEKAIFEVACSIESAEARDGYLKQECGGNHVLYDRVATLLRMREEEPAFLESPAANLGAVIDLPPITERAGTLIGPYKLIEQIGEGGMGLVFMARQQEPVKRNVALKIVKPGMDSKQVIARFEAERQALALMEHPNIARVLDAGSTDSGRPYFVMDLVKGIPITEYCDRERLSTRERLELFIAVCQAIQHAHQKGVIHRDIKPSNVMITLHDGTPVPKVIDFGIAKATNRKLTQETLVTDFGQVIGTPVYMSPEQAELSGLDVDTRTDVYSLGVLLYELLTGTTPFEQETLGQVSYDEMRRVIREEEPPKPSTRISTLGESLVTTAEKRHTDSLTLIRQIKGELDWVAMKALEKNRTRRYETANDLAKDVGRYLNSEPVEACPPSATYRLRKFIRRNKGVATAVAAVAMSLVMGTSVATWQAIRAAKAEEVAKQQAQLALGQKEVAEEAAGRERALRTEAERQQARAEANLRLALEALDEVYIRLMQRLRKGKRLESEDQTLMESALRSYGRFADANRAAPETRPLVESMYGKIVAIRRELAEQSPGVVGYRRALAAASVGLAPFLENAGRPDEATEAYEQAVRIEQQLVDRFPTVAEYRHELAASQDALTNLLVSTGQREQAEKFRAASQATRPVAESATRVPPDAPIRFDGFADLAGFHLLGGASVMDGRLRLTHLDPHGAGAAWTEEKQLVELGFETVFAFQLSGGGDGFAFVLQNDGLSSIGPCGSGEGYGAAYGVDDAGQVCADAAGIPNSLAIEFDTYCNESSDDLAADHISVQTNGRGINSVHHSFSLAAVVVPLGFADGDVHRVRIRYVPGTLEISLDGSAEPTLTASVELSALLRLDRGRAWIGFTASTGSICQTHDILSWEYRPLVDEGTAEAFFCSYPETPDGSEPARAGAEREEGSSIVPARVDEDSPFLRKAVTFYRAFAEQNRNEPSARWEVGKAYWRIGEIVTMLDGGRNEPWAREQSEQAFQTAIDVWQSLDDQGPADADPRKRIARAYSQRATTCLARRDFKKAVQCLKRSAQLDPENLAVRNSLAWTLAVCPDSTVRDPQQAVDLASELVRAKPTDMGFWNTLGTAQYRNGQWDAAIESLRKSDALGEYKGNAFNGFFLAMAYWQIGDRQEARAWYDKAVKWMEQNTPDDQQLARFRAEAAELLGITETLREAKGKANETATKDLESGVRSVVIQRVCFEPVFVPVPKGRRCISPGWSNATVASVAQPCVEVAYASVAPNANAVKDFLVAGLARIRV